MDIFIDKAFFEHFLNVRKIARENESIDSDITLKYVNTIKELLLSFSNKHIDSDWLDEIKIKLPFSKGARNFANLEEMIIHKALLDNKINVFDKEKVDLEINHNACYFLENDVFNAKDRKGILRESTNFNFKSFYNNAEAPNKEVLDGNYQSISQYTFPCSSILYIDKYLIAGERATRDGKLMRLVDFVNCYKRSIQIPFQLTIITSEEENNRVIGKAVFEDSMAFLKSNLPDLELQIIVSNRFFSFGNHNKHDRLFYTNYSMGNIGNPFTSGTTVFNQCFLPIGHDANEINNRTTQYNKEIKQWFNKIHLLENESIRFQTSDFLNRIFIGL
jgi:hypothetical protein